MKILVTGADGFIGSHLVEKLVKLGYQVKAFVLYNSFDSRGWLDSLHKDIQCNIEAVSGDIRDFNSVRLAMRDCDVVFHLAALIAIPYSYEAPESYLDTNIKGTLNVLQAARDLNLGKVVHTSTSEVYGTAKFVPITEEHPLVGQSPYSASKIAADQLAYSYFSSFELPLITIRPFNTYGPRQSARAVIPTVISQIASGQKIINIGSSHPTRDFNYVNDTVDGFISAIHSKSYGEVFNIGSNYEISILDTIKLIAELMNVNINIRTEEDRLRPKNSEVERLWADNSKALSMLQWQPNYAGREGLRRGLMETIDWFIRPENIQKYRANTYVR
jgi:dTDP-glucose 4,6-dehydratase